MSNKKKTKHAIHVYAVGDKIELLKKEKRKCLVGTIRCIGNLYHKQGIWYGIELETAIKTGKTSNGQYQNIQYFVCDNNKALFVQKTQINKKLTSTKAISKSLFIGKKVSVKSVGCNGIIKYIGEHQTTKASSKIKKSSNNIKKKKAKRMIYYGIELENPVGNCSGKYAINNVQYFKCSNNYGVFVTRKDIGRAYIDYDKNELLLCGFIKTINFADNIIIPEDIIILCIKFYVIDNRLHNHILSWYTAHTAQNRNEHGYDAAELIDVSNVKSGGKTYSFRFHWVDERLIQFISSDWSRYGIYYNLKEIVCQYARKKIFETWHVNTRINSVLVRSGGYDGERGGTRTDCWFFDSHDIYNSGDDNIIDGYLCKMPIVNQNDNLDIISQHCFLFDTVNNMMHLLGGHGYDDDDLRWFGTGGVWRLNLNQIGNETKFKWKRIRIFFDNKTHVSPDYAAGEILDYKKKEYLICGGFIGGYGGRHLRSKECYKFHYNIDKQSYSLDKLAKMKYARAQHTICRNDMKNRIIVGSGGVVNDTNDLTNKICEMYDIGKNKWITIKCESTYSYWSCRSCIWSDHLNNNLVYIAGNDTFKHVQYMECIDLRAQKEGWRIQPLTRNSDKIHQYPMQWMMT